MHRITMTLDDELMDAVDTFMHARGHDNRSEAIRDLVRSGLHALAADRTAAAQDCVGALVYVYDHGVRHLPERLIEAQHGHHDLTVATLHVHLDHASCLEVAVLRGKGAEVGAFADGVTGQRGVRYGRLVTVPVETVDERHEHGGSKHAHPHHHVRSAK